MSSCCGLRKRGQDDREPLLPQYRDETEMQRQLHQKLHSYQMFRALADGYMPSNEQVIINLRTLLASDLLNPSDPELSDSGRLLTKYTKEWLKHFVELLFHKNNGDQIQDFIWYLTKSRISVDVEDLGRRASKAKSKANTAAAYQSLNTVGSLLLTNSDFRLFLLDLNVIGREVFKDTAFTLSSVAEDAGKRLEPSQEKQIAVKHPGEDSKTAVSKEDVQQEAAEVSDVVTDGAATVAKEASKSVADKLKGDEKDTLLYRLKQTVLKLRQRNDYSDSVSTLSTLVKRYALVYSRAMQETVNTAQKDVHQNPETDRALKNFWSFVSSFGDQHQWSELQRKLNQVLDHQQNNPQFENVMDDVGNSLQSLLTDPEFFDHADEKFQELRSKSRGLGANSKVRQDVDDFLAQAQITLQSVLHDRDINTLISLSLKIFNILSPQYSITNQELIQDAINFFVPTLINSIQYIPIPRLELSTPDIDLLLESLVLEPGRTINHSSFLPFRFHATTRTDLDVHKTHLRTISTRTATILTISLSGLSLRASDLGFWLRAHRGLFRFSSSGIASFALDDRGIDIELDIEIGRDRLEQMLSLRGVRVRVHKLRYAIRKSRFGWLGWLVKPLLRPILKRVMERQIAQGIAEFCHAANREVVFARERLRATRVAEPRDLITFVRAVAARLAPAEDPDVYARVGVDEPGKGVFKGVYTPASLVEVLKEEGARAGERVEDREGEGWRNGIFDVQAQLG
ncbi:hypothetical protein EV356DRAFT_568294 [Viridothelium virens]|uniref:HAM1-like N-terminal domain-containing protein n=1 Tax=Viridothelium virens TaxID=1048519 RepID=A0A6A6H5J8_VIRVR|nr:hypothetical protein EV356DRAFT_568294 [Viridothelium virens]